MWLNSQHFCYLHNMLSPAGAMYINFSVRVRCWVISLIEQALLTNNLEPNNAKDKYKNLNNSARVSLPTQPWLVPNSFICHFNTLEVSRYVPVMKPKRRGPPTTRDNKSMSPVAKNVILAVLLFWICKLCKVIASERNRLMPFVRKLGWSPPSCTQLGEKKDQEKKSVATPRFSMELFCFKKMM